MGPNCIRCPYDSREVTVWRRNACKIAATKEGGYSAAAATRLLGRLCTILRTHALLNFAVGAVEMERASSHLAALVPTALRLWVTSAGAERASPLALLRRLFEVVAADASPCGSSCTACKRCRDASVPPPSAARPPG